MSLCCLRVFCTSQSRVSHTPQRSLRANQARVAARKQRAPPSQGTLSHIFFLPFPTAPRRFANLIHTTPRLRLPEEIIRPPDRGKFCGEFCRIIVRCPPQRAETFPNPTNPSTSEEKVHCENHTNNITNADNTQKNTHTNLQAIKTYVVYIHTVYNTHTQTHSQNSEWRTLCANTTRKRTCACAAEFYGSCCCCWALDEEDDVVRRSHRHTAEQGELPDFASNSEGSQQANGRPPSPRRLSEIAFVRFFSLSSFASCLWFVCSLVLDDVLHAYFWQSSV